MVDGEQDRRSVDGSALQGLAQDELSHAVAGRDSVRRDDQSVEVRGFQPEQVRVLRQVPAGDGDRRPVARAGEVPPYRTTETGILRCAFQLTAAPWTEWCRTPLGLAEAGTTDIVNMIALRASQHARLRIAPSPHSRPMPSSSVRRWCSTVEAETVRPETLEDIGRTGDLTITRDGLPNATVVVRILVGTNVVSVLHSDDGAIERARTAVYQRVGGRVVDAG